MSIRPGDLTLINTDFTNLEHLFDFDRDQLGRQATDVTADAILDFMDAELDADGVPFEPLSPSYALEKEAIRPGQPIGELFGLMKATVEITGERTIAPKTIVQQYGTNAITRSEADKFQQGGKLTGTRQPERSFYAFNYLANSRLARLFDRYFQKT